MLMNIAAISLSALLIWSTSVDSPLLVLHNWEILELLRLFLIFLFLYCLQYTCKIIKASNIAAISIIALLVLINFGLGAVTSVFLVAFSTGVIGRRLTSNTQWKMRSNIGFHLAIGYAVAVGYLQIALHFRINSKEVLILISIFSLIFLHRETANLLSDIVEYYKRPFVMGRVAFIFSFGIALSILVFVSFPETHSDALILNLRIANQVGINGIWSFATELYSWAIWPKGAAWLQTVHYILGGEAGARLFNWFAIIVTALLIYKEAVRLGFLSNVGIMVAFFLSTPITFWCAFVLFDDAVFGLFVTATMISAVNSSSNFSPKGIFITLLLCSAAMATKITGLFIPPIIFTIYCFRFIIEKPNYKWEGNSSFVKYGLACIPILTIGAFPYIFSYIRTSNPIFPLYNDIFQARDYPVERFQDLRWGATLGWNAVFKMSSNTSNYMEGYNWTFGIQNALFFIPVVLEVARRRKNIDFLLYGLSVVIFSVLMLSQMRYVRYLYPVFPIYAILIAGFLHRAKSGVFKLFIVIFSAAAIFINLINVKSLNMFYKFDFKTLSVIDDRRFVDYFEKSLNEFVNVEYGTSARVLYLHRSYSAGLHGTALNYHWASPVVKSEVDNVKNEIDAVRLIRKYAITHIIVDEIAIKSETLPFARFISDISAFKKQSGTAQLWKVDDSVVSNEPIKLNNKYGANYLENGWLEPEPWGVWARGDTSTLAVRVVARNANSHVFVKAIVMPYVPIKRLDEIKFSVFVNGKFIQNSVLRPEQVHQELVFDIPESYIGSDNMVKIKFQFSNAFDESKLQLGFSEIKFDYN